MVDPNIPSSRTQAQVNQIPIKLAIFVWKDKIEDPRGCFLQGTVHKLQNFRNNSSEKKIAESHEK
jgi:hypothetical protein